MAFSFRFIIYDAGVFFCFLRKKQPATINQPPKPKICSLITIKQICFVLQIVTQIRIQIIIDNRYLSAQNNIEHYFGISLRSRTYLHHDGHPFIGKQKINLALFQRADQLINECLCKVSSLNLIFILLAFLFSLSLTLSVFYRSQAVKSIT